MSHTSLGDIERITDYRTETHSFSLHNTCPAVVSKAHALFVPSKNRPETKKQPPTPLLMTELNTVKNGQEKREGVALVQSVIPHLVMHIEELEY